MAANVSPIENLAPNFASILSPARVSPQSWTPPSTGAAPRCLLFSLALSSASSVVSSSSYASMMSGALLPARAPPHTGNLGLDAAAMNFGITRAAPFETLRLASHLYTGGASAWSSLAGRLFARRQRISCRPHNEWEELISLQVFSVWTKSNTTTYFCQCLIVLNPLKEVLEYTRFRLQT